jgi:hypothetical protein
MHSDALKIPESPYWWVNQQICPYLQKQNLSQNLPDFLMKNFRNGFSWLPW